MKNKNIILLLFALPFFVFSCQQSADVDATETSEEEKVNWKDKPIEFNLPDGFVLEDLYSPKEHRHGSWVSLAEGPNGRFYACDQHGDLYQFQVPAIGAVLDSTQVDSVDLDIGHAHGLIWAFDALYMAVNKSWDDDIPDEEEYGSGIYRLTDTNDDGALDKIDMLLKLEGSGEHGPHSFLVSPDGTELYFIAGNFVGIPDEVKGNSRLPNNWGEDNLFEPYLDARGHANELKAPGGWVAKFKPDGSDWELMAAGFRNPFDFAFNDAGELFVYDADMEWDIGMPWYRPTRVLHATSGSDFGWRTGSGKWPAYYPDGLPAMHNLEQGSPTGVLYGGQLNFPAKYKNGLFVNDWSFGTMYFLELKEKGSTYEATREEFLSGKPLPLTDMVAGSDGHLYFASGGRNLKSHLFRLRYTGAETGEAKLMSDNNMAAMRKLRSRLEAYHNQRSSKAIPLAWEHLAHPDRHIRYAARVALEHQPTHQWELRLFRESDTEKILQASLAMARQGHKGIRDKLLNKLDRVKWDVLSDRQRVDLLRVYQLIFIRMGAPQGSTRAAVLAKLKPHFSGDDRRIAHELVPLLLYLDPAGATPMVNDLVMKHMEANTGVDAQYLSSDVIDRSEDYGPLIKEVIENMPPGEAIYYAMLLSHVEEGWTKELREQYFKWYFDVMAAKGGKSMKPFLENMKNKALKQVPEDQRAYYQELSGVYSPATELADLPQPIGPGREYSSKEITSLMWEHVNVGYYKGSIEDGKRAFEAALCSTCHRMRGEGSSIGPDLTTVESKFSTYELMFSIISPHDEISDQYANTIFNMKDGSRTIGRIASEKDDVVKVVINPYNPSYTVDLAKADITSRELSPVSPMPPSLLNRLNEDEIVHLFAYLLSGADEENGLYTGIEKEEEEGD
ncbi:MAG: c-type cytochrome [Bacteroidota bacterium]